MRYRGPILISLLALNALVFSWVAAVEPSLKVAFIDVGQGDAIYIEAPNGNQVLIDGGRDRGVLRELGEVMPWSDKSLDLIIATHPDADHIGGLPAVLTRYEVAGVMTNGAVATTQIFKTLVADIKKEEAAGARFLLARRGVEVDLGGGVTLKILYPLGAPAGRDTNLGSVVARLSDGYHSFLLTGDAPLAAENYLLTNDRELMDVEVLKAGHHGSRTSSGSNFINAASPLYAIISAGANNNYGHPHPEVMSRLGASGAQILETSKEGTIICWSSAAKLTCQ